MLADASVRKRLEVGLEIMRLKFNAQAQHMTKINITHVQQPDAVSCGAMVFYYAEKIISGNIFWSFYVCTLQRRIQGLVKIKVEAFCECNERLSAKSSILDAKKLHLRCLTEL